jgi:hypothetical protein
VEVLANPRRFFRNGVAPGDQAPGLVFGVLVALCFVAGRLLTGDAVVTDDLPFAGGAGALSTLFVFLVVALVIAPATLHLLAALQTLLLVLFVPDRAGVSETVQVIAYAAAPCVLAGVPYAPLRLAVALYGAALLAVGVAVVHETSVSRAALVTAVPSALLFGYVFRGFAAGAAIVEWVRQAASAAGLL